MKCPNCKKKIGLAKQIKEWDETYGDEVAGAEAIVNIWCENCEDMTIMVSFYRNLEEEIIESPALKSKVSLKMPKRMRGNSIIKRLWNKIYVWFCIKTRRPF